LLDQGCGRQDLGEVLGINLFISTLIPQIIMVNICGHTLIKIHVSFFKVVEKIAHRLAKLMLRGGGVNAAVRPGINPSLAEQYHSSSRRRIREHVKSNFLCNIGYGDPATLMPRDPRLDFSEACIPRAEAK
jgi:hypothetical protein